MEQLGCLGRGVGIGLGTREQLNGSIRHGCTVVVEHWE